jgi:hypothetical protein
MAAIDSISVISLFQGAIMFIVASAWNTALHKSIGYIYPVQHDNVRASMIYAVVLTIAAAIVVYGTVLLARRQRRREAQREAIEDGRTVLDNERQMAVDDARANWSSGGLKLGG